MGAVPRLENGWASRPWGFESLPFRFTWRHGRVGKAARCYRVDGLAVRRFDSCCLRPIRGSAEPPGVVQIDNKAYQERRTALAHIPV
jgi:hypothetical protein